jgi:hypothetical protein
VSRLAPVDAARGPAARGPLSRPRRGRLAALAAVAWAAAGCAALGGTLEVPPGHRVVLGGIDLRRFREVEAVLEIVRSDEAYRHDLRVGPAPGAFAFTLPPGRYRVARVRLLESRRALPEQPAFDLDVGFEVAAAAPAVYIGTLRLVRDFGPRVQAEVVDEYERAVPALRARHPEIGDGVARSLMRPVSR